MVAIRHGTSNRIWKLPGGKWMWETPTSLAKAWKAMKSLGLVESEINEHKIVTINLEEA